MDSHCVMCGSYLADASRMVCEKCERGEVKVVSKRKYHPGEVIVSLDEMSAQEFIYIHDKIYHRGWWQSLQFRFLKLHMDAGYIRKAIRGTEDAK